MDENVKRRAHRERLALGDSAMSGPSVKYGARIISPIITNRPEIDSMLGDMAFCSKRFLELMRNKLMDGDMPDRNELRDFKDTCETVLRQAKVEMELEKHADQRQASMTADEIRDTIQHALSKAGQPQKVTDLVLDALGVSRPN